MAEIDSIPTLESSASSSSSNSSKTHHAIQALSSILETESSPPLLSSQALASTLLHDPVVADQISSLLHHPDSGAGDNNLCRWFYDTFQSSVTELQLVVLRFVPIICGLYLTRVQEPKPLAGFEAILLALYAHETTSRGGQCITLNVIDLYHPSVYHDAKELVKTTGGGNEPTSTERNLSVVSVSLDPHGTVRATRRARIVGVALELYYKNSAWMPVKSKIEFCEFVVSWSGHGTGIYSENLPSQCLGDDGGKAKMGRVPLPWELFQPILRILGHCLLGPNSMKEKEQYDAACAACSSLHARAMHEMEPNAILATRSLLRLGIMANGSKDEVDYTELVMANAIALTIPLS